jgi:hypothetical protein
MRPTFLIAVLCIWLIAPASAQQGPLPPGKNGYDDLVKAVEVLRTSRLFPKAENQDGEGKTLAYRRGVLDEKAVQETVRLIRLGLGKAIVPPQPKSPTDLPTENWSGFRRLGRLIQMRGYVLLADGRTEDALDNTRMGLRLATGVRSETMIGGLVAVALNALATTPVASHLDQLSARDCQSLFRVCQEWLDQPDPLIRIYEGERRFALASLDQMLTEAAKAAPDKAAKPDDPDDDDEPLTPEQQRQLRELARDPQAVARFKQDTLARMDRFYQDLRQELAKPLPQRHLQAPQPDGTVAGTLIAQLCPVFEQSNIAFARDTARMRLLACHAAILRCRWEHDKLPDSLSALNLGPIGQDPFTGADFRYERDGRRYKLYSVGPEGDADNPKTIEGRLPFSIVPGDF